MENANLDKLLSSCHKVGAIDEKVHLIGIEGFHPSDLAYNTTAAL
jgi:hypothetical protein